MYYLDKTPYEIAITFLYITISFMVGGIPFGLILSKLIKKTDIRKFGSGNIGATNVFRLMGFKYAALTFILDGLKSYLPVLIAKKFFGIGFAINVLCATTLGHIFSPWLKFHGGKGFSSFMLGILAIDIRLFLTSAIIWLFIFFIGHISAMATLISTFVTVTLACFLYKFVVIPVIFLMLVIFWAHRKNIKGMVDSFKDVKV